jgi:hypothetical protein
VCRTAAPTARPLASERENERERVRDNQQRKKQVAKKSTTGTRKRTKTKVNRPLFGGATCPVPVRTPPSAAPGCSSYNTSPVCGVTRHGYGVTLVSQWCLNGLTCRAAARQLAVSPLVSRPGPAHADVVEREGCSPHTCSPHSRFSLFECPHAHSPSCSSPYSHRDSRSGRCCSHSHADECGNHRCFHCCCCDGCGHHRCVRSGQRGSRAWLVPFLVDCHRA